MRANIPPHPTEEKNPPQPTGELQGVYLHAMQEVSARLMDSLPADDDLWQTLAQTESLLLEAQMMNAPLREVFGNGGVAAFCQSILDEFAENGVKPAAAEHHKRVGRTNREPTGGVNYHRKRRGTAILIATFAVAFFLLAGWYVGIFRYIAEGSAFYLQELHNFGYRQEAVETLPIRFTLPLVSQVDIGQVLYTDPSGATITLDALEYTEHTFRTDVAAESGTVRRYNRWQVRLEYPVDATFTEIRYVAPSTGGKVTLILADGTSYPCELHEAESGSSGRGTEYIYLTVADLPASVNTEGATLTVELEPPRRIVWERTGVGIR